MASDYKSSRRPVAKKRRRVSNKTRPRRRKSKLTPGWVWLLCGLGLGLTIAVVTYFLVQPETETAVAVKSAPKKAAQAVAPKTTAIKTEDEKQHFDFYTLLPKMEVVIPDSVIDQANRALPQHETNLAYVLQTGSFRNASDAETMKAELALIGIEADVETVVINDKDTWHRVRLGPFPSMKALNPARRQLKQNNINFLLLKIKI